MDGKIRKSPRYFVAGDSEGTEAGTAELNWLEFPFGTLQDDGRKTLELVDHIKDKATGLYEQRKVIITGSDKWGLPTPVDVDVALALMKLTKEQHGWRESYLRFSIYEVCKQLRLPTNDGGFHTRRIAQAILTIKATTICYQNAWRKGDKWTSTEAFSLLDNVKLSNTKEHFDADEEQRVKWNDCILESMQGGHSKGLDWEFYLSLGKPSTKRLFTFLDKRWDHMTGLTYGLEAFCVNKLGMKPGQEAKKYRQNLKRPIEELCGRGFPLAADFDGRGKNSRVIFEKKRQRRKRAIEAKPQAERKPNRFELELVARGVTAKEATRLTGDQANEKQIGLALEWLAWLESKGEAPNNPGGWLRKVIEQGWQPPDDFETKEKREAKKKAIAAIVAKREADNLRQDQKRKAAEERKELAVREYLEALPSDAAREQLEKEALESNPFARKAYHSAKKDGVDPDTYLETAVKGFVLKKLKANA